MDARRTRNLASRLLRSHLAVMALAVVAMFILGAVIAPRVFGPEFTNFGPNGDHRRPPRELRDTFNRAMFLALVVGVIGAVTAAGIMARRVARRLSATLAALADATRRLAAGDYSVRAPGSRTTELANLANDINALAERLDETEQSRLRLIGDVAHELRTPLTTIEGSMEALLDGVVEPTDDVFASIAREASRLERLADDLSNLSKAGERSSALDLRPADASGVVVDVADRLRPQFDAKGVELSVAPITALVEIDVDRFAQVVTNIVGNALAYTPPGGRVGVTMATDNGRAVVTVADSGIGLDADHLDQVFERFFRSGGGSGTGVGLTIARTLARRMGGDVTATSPGRSAGSTFTITIPLT